MKQRKALTITAASADGWHVTYRKGDGYSAYIDDPYYSANYLGSFDTLTEALEVITAQRLANATLLAA